MNAPERRVTAPPLAGLAFALLAPPPGESSREAAWLGAWRERAFEIDADPGAAWRSWCAAPPPADQRLHALCKGLGLGSAETLALALTIAVELDPMAGRVLAWLQSPSGGSRPTPGLVMTLASAVDGVTPDSHLAALVAGPARECGLVQIESESRPLPECALRTSVSLASAIAGLPSSWPGVQSGLADPAPLSPSVLAQAARYATALSAEPHALAIRCGHPREAKAVAVAIAAALRKEVAFIVGEPAIGIGPWLLLTNHLPVYCAELAPGELRALPALPGYHGPVLVATGPDGRFESAGEPAANWRVPPPNAHERVALWRGAAVGTQLADSVGIAFRHSAVRIQNLVRAGRFQAALNGRGDLTVEDVEQAGRGGAAADLGTLAELLPDRITDDALVLPPSLRAELEALSLRCIARDTLVDSLGPAARARHRPGARALLYGPSGTGKTLAVGWLATRLGLPLYRVDLASVTSKYIGETEKNLAQLFARAEHAEVVLMFDEADALFGKRTDVKDSNDRFANAQTNYLLQRIESFEGVAILTSNSRARFDSAFTRRLDAIIEFPAPGPEERRALWLAHLGDAHTLTGAELNRLAAYCDLAGGHIRNAVLVAVARARQAGRQIGYADVAAGIVAEFRKLGRQAPHGLSADGAR